MAKPSGKVLVQIELKPETAVEIAKSVQVEGMTDISKLSSVASGLMEQLAEGGIMLDVDDVRRLRDTGRDIEDAADIVVMAETAAGFRAGQFTISADIDPDTLPAMKEYAATCGLELNELGTQMMAMAIDQGWIWEVQPGYRAVRLTPETTDLICSITALPKDFSGEQLARWLREQVLGIVEEEPPISPEREKEPVLP